MIYSETVPVSEGDVAVEGGKVHYSIYGEGDKIPLIVLHGGPGFPSSTMSPIKKLAGGRQVVLYDQLGVAESPAPSDTSLWRIERFVTELSQLREHLGFPEIALLGQSWGTMLAVDYMLTEPKGVKTLILTSPCLDAERWKLDADRLRKQLSVEHQEALIKHEQAGTTDSQEYQDIVMEYLNRFACRMNPWPSDLLKAFELANMELYNYMWGPSEFFPTGTLKNYNRVEDLNKIKVPTLFTCGRYDEATPESTEFYHKNLSGSEFVVFEESAHCAMFEEKDRFLSVINEFLLKQNI